MAARMNRIKRRIKSLLYASMGALLRRAFFRKIAFRSLLDRDTYLIKRTPAGDFAFYPDETIGRFLYQEGEYSRDFTEKAIRFVRSRSPNRRARVWLEVGANIGTQTVYAKNSKAFDSYYCIEPDPANVSLLMWNLKINDMIDASHVHQVGIGAREAVLQLNRNEWNFGAATFRSDGRLPAHDSPHFSSSGISVPVTTLDDFVARNGLAAEDIGMIWIDVEGFEAEVVKGMPAIMKSRAPICIEYSPQRLGEEERDDFLRRVAESNREVFALCEASQEFVQVDAADVTKLTDLILI